MSSSAHRQEPFFVVQSGIVAWEETSPVSDWASKTVTVCAPRLALLENILWDLALTPDAVRVFRWHVATVPAGSSRLQQRRMMSSMEVDPPGFSRTTVELRATTICMASELLEPSAVDLEYLSSYRTTALLATPWDVDSVSALCRTLCGKISELGSAGISALRAMSPTWTVLRVVELETHAVVQLIGSTEAAVSAERTLVEQGVRRVLDTTAVPSEIRRWTS